MTVAVTVRESARRAGHTSGEAEWWMVTGDALEGLGGTEEAIGAVTHARDLFRTAGDAVARPARCSTSATC